MKRLTTGRNSPTHAALRSVWCVNRPVSGLVSGSLAWPETITFPCLGTVAHSIVLGSFTVAGAAPESNRLPVSLPRSVARQHLKTNGKAINRGGGGQFVLSLPKALAEVFANRIPRRAGQSAGRGAR